MLSRLKSVFSLLQYVDVRDGPVPLNDFSSFITERDAAIQEPVIDFIRAPAAELIFDGRSCGQCGLPVGHHSIDVVGVHCAHPTPTYPLFSGEARVVQPPLADEVERSIRQIGTYIGRNRLNENLKLLLAEPDFLFCPLCLSNIDDRPCEL